MRSTLLLLSLFFTYVATAQPANDDPCGATAVGVQTGTTCTPSNAISWTNATASAGVPDPACASYSTGDIWFKFVSPSSGRVNINTAAGSGPGAITDGGMALYGLAGVSCSDALALIQCNDDGGPGSMPAITISGLSAGRTYYIRFWSFYDETSGNIGGICVTDPSPALSLGKVGVGIQNGDATLDVNGNIKVRGGSPGSGKILTSDASGIATWQTPPTPPVYTNPSINTGFHVNRVLGFQSIASGSYKKLGYANVKFNQGSTWGGDSTYTCPTTGTYHFDAQVSWDLASFAGTHSFYITIFVDGGNASTIFANGTYAELSSKPHLSISGIVQCTAGDKVWISVFHDSGIAQNVDPTGTYFTGYRAY